MPPSSHRSPPKLSIMYPYMIPFPRRLSHRNRTRDRPPGQVLPRPQSWRSAHPQDPILDPPPEIKQVDQRPSIHAPPPNHRAPPRGYSRDEIGFRRGVLLLLRKARLSYHHQHFRPRKRQVPTPPYRPRLSGNAVPECIFAAVPTPPSPSFSHDRQSSSTTGPPQQEPTPTQCSPSQQHTTSPAGNRRL